MPAQRMVVFSDLDGTLLDHDTYDWRPARPALAELARRRIPLVLVSSKTLPEIERHRQDMGLRGPVVAENGAAIDVPPGYFPASPRAGDLAVDRESLQRALGEMRSIGGYDCVAFFELGDAGIAEATGLTLEEAGLANRRTASEPLLWRDSEERLAEFRAEAGRRGLRAVRGGRFVHLMGNIDKAVAVQRLAAAYRRKWPDAKLTTVALGDGPNDLDMLRAADIAVVIPGRHGHEMPLDDHDRVVRPASPGPAGWLEAMRRILEFRAPPQNRQNSLD